MTTIALKIREVITNYQAQFPDDERPSIAEIAVYAGINPGTLNNYMMGHTKRPDLELLGKLCHYLEIKDVREIFEIVEVEE